MPIDFSIQQQTRIQSPMTTSTEPSIGSLFGSVAMEVESPLSLLADAAEELTFAADTTDDFELDERKERDEIDEAMSERVKMYRQLMNESGAAEKIDRLKDSIKARAGKEDVLRMVRQTFPDPSDAYAALQDIHESLKNDSHANPAVLESVEAALQEMEDTEGAQIRAGIQGALAARGFPDLGDNAKGLYRQTVCDFQNPLTLFTHIQKKYGDNFDLAVDFLYKALANDLACDVPSMEKTHLEQVNANLGEMRSLQSAHSLCSRLMDRWQNIHGIKQCNLDTMGLLGQVLALRGEQFLSTSRINTIAEKANAPDIEHKVLFLQELLGTTRSFSPTLFDGNEGRMKILNAVQEAVDTAVAEEDEYLASQE